MFRIVCFVEDKNLAKALRGLKGIALNMEVPQEVVNAAVKGGKVVQDKPGASITERLTAELQTFAKGTPVDATGLRALIVHLGGAEGSYSSYATRMVADKVLKRKSQGKFVTA